MAVSNSISYASSHNFRTVDLECNAMAAVGWQPMKARGHGAELDIDRDDHLKSATDPGGGALELPKVELNSRKERR